MVTSQKLLYVVHTRESLRRGMIRRNPKTELRLVKTFLEDESKTNKLLQKLRDGSKVPNGDSISDDRRQCILDALLNQEPPDVSDSDPDVSDSDLDEDDKSGSRIDIYLEPLYSRSVRVINIGNVSYQDYRYDDDSGTMKLEVKGPVQTLLTVSYGETCAYSGVISGSRCYAEFEATTKDFATRFHDDELETLVEFIEDSEGREYRQAGEAETEG